MPAKSENSRKRPAKTPKEKSTTKTERKDKEVGARQTPTVAPASSVPFRDLGAKAAAPKAMGAKAANTIVYVHGIGNKPTASVLKCQWDTALFNAKLGDRSRMAHWVNRDYYPRALVETCASGDFVRIEDDEATTRAIMAVAGGKSGTEELALSNEIKALTEDPDRQAWLGRVAAKLDQGTAVTDADLKMLEVRAKLLPKFLRCLITRKITRVFLRDLNDFLFVAERRDAMEQSFIDRLATGGGPFVVIAHSLGSMIAYDVLRRLTKAECDVKLFVTLSSPLGLQEVQDALRQWTGGPLPFPPCVDRWLNVADRLDPVAFDADISNDFEGRIENHSGICINPDSPQHPSSGTGYLKIGLVRDAVRDTVGSAFSQAVAPFIVAKDLAGDLEDSRRDQRHATLIQLVNEGRGLAATPKRLSDVGEEVEHQIRRMLAASGEPVEAAGIERLRHFVAANLTRLEVETLRSLFGDLKIEGIWRNATKNALIHASTHTVQARPANLGYGASGHDICWAVLDTGIRANHPHFQKRRNVLRQWDCTRAGAPVELAPGTVDFNQLDKHGHGTHVAAIIAGGYGPLSGPDGVDVTMNGMAPHCSLYGFKVLDDRGNGRDSWIIKALDQVAEINEEAGQLVIQGINLSLGGSFDPSVYGVRPYAPLPGAAAAVATRHAGVLGRRQRGLCDLVRGRWRYPGEPGPLHRRPGQP